jgi:hypothetical protein
MHRSTTDLQLRKEKTSAPYCVFHSLEGRCKRIFRAECKSMLALKEGANGEWRKIN